MKLDVLASVIWVVSQLKAAGVASGRIYAAGAVPRSATYPLVVVSQSEGLSVQNATADRIGYNDLVLVKAVDPGADNTVPADLVNDAITALHKTQGAITGGSTCIACVLEQPLPLPPVSEDGVTYQQFGAEFRVFTQ